MAYKETAYPGTALLRLSLEATEKEVTDNPRYPKLLKAADQLVKLQQKFRSLLGYFDLEQRKIAKSLIEEETGYKALAGRHKETAAVAGIIQQLHLLEDAKLVVKEDHMALIRNNDGSYTVVIDKTGNKSKYLLAYYKSAGSPIKKHVTDITENQTHAIVILEGFGPSNKALRDRIFLFGLFSQVLADEGAHMQPSLAHAISTTKFEVNESTGLLKRMAQNKSSPIAPEALARIDKLLYKMTVSGNIGFITNPKLWHVSRESDPVLLVFSPEPTYKLHGSVIQSIRETFVTTIVAAVDMYAHTVPEGNRLYTESVSKHGAINGYEENCLFIRPEGSGPKTRIQIDLDVNTRGPITSVKVFDGSGLGGIIGAYDFARASDSDIVAYLVEDAIDYYSQHMDEIKEIESNPIQDTLIQDTVGFADDLNDDLSEFDDTEKEFDQFA